MSNNGDDDKERPRHSTRRPGLRIGPSRAHAAFYIRRGNEFVKANSEDVPEDIRNGLRDEAIQALAVVIAGMRELFGVVIHGAGDNSKQYAYHWHDLDGTCHLDKSREGFETIPAAILGAICELSHLWKLNGAAPIIAGLRAAGIDLGEIAINLPPDMADRMISEVYQTAMETTKGLITEAAKEQPSGFSGELVAAFLALARDLVRFFAPDAHQAQQADQIKGQMPLPGVLPSGHIAVPAQALLLLEGLLQQLDQRTPGEQRNEPRSNTTLAA